MIEEYGTFGEMRIGRGTKLLEGKTCPSASLHRQLVHVFMDIYNIFCSHMGPSPGI
jgi:hypothetical protein